MISIIKAKEEDIQLLIDIAGKSFTESHGSSTSADNINAYVNEKYTYKEFEKELNDTNNIYHIINYDKQPVGYSKIIFNVTHPDIQIKNITKLERIYLLKEFYSLKIGVELFKFNVDLSKKNNQEAMWLFVWKENHRAVNFYKKAGIKIIGSYDFKITATHSNPNHHMLLVY